MKWRNSKERELLSTGGGSRDVTLPSKDNPHPDLSDVNDCRDATDVYLSSSNDYIGEKNKLPSDLIYSSFSGNICTKSF